MKALLVIIISVIISGCKGHPEESDLKYHSSILKGKIIRMINDSVKLVYCNEFDKNGNLLSDGNFYYLNDTLIYRVDWHNFYKGTKIISRKEFYVAEVNKKPQEIISQFLIYDSNGDTIKDKSFYFTIRTNESNRLKIGDTLDVEILVNYKNNSKKISGNYKLNIYNSSLNDSLIELQFDKPILKYNFPITVSDTINLEGYINFFIPNEKGDSVMPINMNFNRRICLKR
jgi:hypothetical protein